MKTLAIIKHFVKNLFHSIVAGGLLVMSYTTGSHRDLATYATEMRARTS